MMATELPVITDWDDTATQVVALKQTITSLCFQAKREFARVGTPLMPTPWDRYHARINAKLDELQRLG